MCEAGLVTHTSIPTPLTYSSTHTPHAPMGHSHHIRACLKLVPHEAFTFAKIWLMAAHFEVGPRVVLIGTLPPLTCMRMK